MRDPIGTLLLAFGLACIFIAGCSALGIALIEITFRP